AVPPHPPNYGGLVMSDILSSLYEKRQASEDESDIIVIEELATDCPILHDFLRFTRFNGKPVVPPRLGYFVEGGKLLVSLSDSERRRSLRVFCVSFHDGCRHIESHIAAGTLDVLWYQWKEKNGRPGKKSTAS
ncbi:unnamed protein product, partial [marine sediment metagenome]